MWYDMAMWTRLIAECGRSANQDFRTIQTPPSMQSAWYAAAHGYCHGHRALGVTDCQACLPLITETAPRYIPRAVIYYSLQSLKPRLHLQVHIRDHRLFRATTRNTFNTIDSQAVDRVTSGLCDCVHLCPRPKRKTDWAINIQCMAVVWHALTPRSKGQGTWLSDELPAWLRMSIGCC